MTLSVIVVSYNVSDFLRQTLRTLTAALKGIESEIIVVDNASTDDSTAMVSSRFPEVKLIASKENLGFAKANNLGMDAARGQVIALVNPDTLIRDDTFQVCLDYLHAHADVGMVGCKILNPDGSLQLACRRSFPTPGVALSKILGLSALFPSSRRFGRYNLTFLHPDQVHDVEAISGSFMVIRRAVITEIGGLDERFFMYGEDLDFCYRIHQAGYRIVYLPQAEIIHYKGQSATQAGFRALIHFYDAMRLFVEKHFEKGWLWLPRWLLLAGIGLRGLLSFIAKVVRAWLRPSADMLGLQLALCAALWLRFGHLHHYISYLPVNALYTVLWLGMLFIAGRYKDRNEGLQRLFAGMALGGLINASLTFFLPQYAFSRQVLISMGLLGGLFIWLLDGVGSLMKRGWRPGKIAAPRTLMIGMTPSQMTLIKQWRCMASPPYKIAGHVLTSPTNMSHKDVSAYDILGELEDVPRILSLHKIEQVIFPFENAHSWPILMAYQWRQHSSVLIKMTKAQNAVQGIQERYDALRLIPLQLVPFRIDEPLYKLSKRILDLLLCLVTALPAAVSHMFRSSLLENSTRLWANWTRCWYRVFKGQMTWVGIETNENRSDGQGALPRITGCIAPQGLIEPAGCLEDKRPVLSFYLSQYTPWLDVQIIVQTWQKARKMGKG